ncbi:MAG: hypothetical protein WDZ83_03610 [Rhizobiaceae bacterium]
MIGTISLENADKILKSMKDALKLKIPLKDDDGENLWFQHSKLGQKIDIAGIAFDQDTFDKSICICVNEIDDKIGRLGVSESVFIVGYLDAVNLENRTPIWKNASVASEPSGRINNEDCFLVDARTQAGMSGSPVFRRPPLIANSILVDGKDIKVSHTEFVGIYSGRHRDQHVASSVEDQRIRQFMEENYLDLGFVWPTKLIDEMLADNCTGSFELTQ